jgi:hypothetical protein
VCPREGKVGIGEGHRQGVAKLNMDRDTGASEIARAQDQSGCYNFKSFDLSVMSFSNSKQGTCEKYWPVNS